jgi:hydrogenase expression/formation protein HypD
MQYIDEFRNSAHIGALAEAIRKTAVHSWRIMEICGGQTHTIARYRLEDLLPPNVSLLHGPGCPVCVTPASAIDFAIKIALSNDVIFASFGDMLRVPGNETDLLNAKARGADVRILYSPLDAVKLAENNPNKQIVFFAVGFETTAPVHLTALKEAERRGLKNFSLLCSLFAVPPAVEMLLSQPECTIDGFLTAGHVCAVTGNEAYRRLSEKYHRPMVVTGFEPADLLYGIYLCVRQLESNKFELENAYKRAVTDAGNIAAQQLMTEYLAPADREWRGIGIIPSSGFTLKNKYDLFNAFVKFGDLNQGERYSLSNQCIAGSIMKGAASVSDCPFFGTACNPDHPIGAPMVSDEGVCAAFYKYRQV